jgi:triacylglycerol lipase
MAAIDNDFTTAGFSAKTAYYLAGVAQAAYLTDLAGVAVELGFPPDTAILPFGEFFGFVADVGGQVVLAFRGTDSIQTWLADARVVQVQDPAYPGKVHSGFAAAVELMWPGLRERLPAGRPVWVTGHSLGGAMATLASVRLAGEGYPVPGVYTFGSPRVGDLDFYDAYQAGNYRAYRVVNNDDIVPHVPLEHLVVGGGALGLRHFAYKHVGELKYLGADGLLGESPSGWGAKKDYVLDALLRRGGTPWPQAVEDHLIANYISALASNLPAAA